MRQKTIREAVVVVTLGIFLLTSAPAIARSASSAQRPAQRPGWSLSLFEGWITSWVGALLERPARAATAGNQAKAATAPPAVSSESSSATTDRSAAIDPLGFK
jgi:hypothetical protein